MTEQRISLLTAQYQRAEGYRKRLAELVKAAKAFRDGYDETGPVDAHVSAEALAEWQAFMVAVDQEWEWHQGSDLIWPEQP